MADVLTPDQRRRNMQAIRNADTKPEMIVRRFVHRMGYRFRLHRRDLPGRPDLVLPRHRKLIHVHGCFWHMHDCPYGRVVPATNREFWQHKRQANVARDERNLKAAFDQGWTALVIWECETRDQEALGRRLADLLADARAGAGGEGSGSSGGGGVVDEGVAASARRRRGRAAGGGRCESPSWPKNS